MLKRMAQFAEKHKVSIAYHTHAQGSMTAFDEALTMSKWNMSNVDLGHYVAAGNNGGSPLQFLEAHHGRIASFHLKDRTLPEHCSLTVPFGKGDGQIKDILLLMKKNKWTFPATIELESPIPADSDAVQEVKKCGRLRPRHARLTPPLVRHAHNGPAREPARLSLEGVSD